MHAHLVVNLASRMLFTSCRKKREPMHFVLLTFVLDRQWSPHLSYGLAFPPNGVSDYQPPQRHTRKHRVSNPHLHFLLSLYFSCRSTKYQNRGF